MKLKTKTSKSILIIILILIILLLVLSVLEFFPEKIPSNSEEKLINIQDKCGIILGNLIHEIRDKEDCDLRCFNECNIQNLEKVKIEFSNTPKENNSCYQCDCYCK
jgi:hypothetical protein